MCTVFVLPLPSIRMNNFIVHLSIPDKHSTPTLLFRPPPPLLAVLLVLFISNGFGFD